MLCKCGTGKVRGLGAAWSFCTNFGGTVKVTGPWPDFSSLVVLRGKHLLLYQYLKPVTVRAGSVQGVQVLSHLHLVEAHVKVIERIGWDREASVRFAEWRKESVGLDLRHRKNVIIVV